MIQSNMVWMQQQVANGTEPIDPQLARMEAAGPPNVALAGTIDDAVRDDAAQREGMQPTEAEVQAQVARDRAAPQPPGLQAYIQAVGADRYWASQPAALRVALAREKLQRAHRTGNTPAQQTASWNAYHARLLAAAHIEVLDAAALDGATVQGALDYLKAVATTPTSTP